MLAFSISCGLQSNQACSTDLQTALHWAKSERSLWLKSLGISNSVDFQRAVQSAEKQSVSFVAVMFSTGHLWPPSSSLGSPERSQNTEFRSGFTGLHEEERQRHFG